MINVNTLQRLWESKKLPIFNGLIFKDGRLLTSVFKDGDIQFVKPFLSATLDTLLAKNPEELISINELGRHHFNDKEYLSFGGGSFGGDGYIGYVVEEFIEWVVFFDWSSDFGFCSRIDEDSLLVYQDNYSTEGCLVSKLSPEKIKWILIKKV